MNLTNSMVVRLVVIGLLLVIGFLLRLQGTADVGYNIDEIEKAIAAEAYLRGNFAVDQEHPMLLKLLLAFTYVLFESSEATTRLLMAFLGALTIPLVYLLATRRLNPCVGLISAALITVSPYAAAVNHTVKEDTLYMVLWLFTLQALLSVKKPGDIGLYFTALGLGLAIASKYNFPLLVMIMGCAIFVFSDIRVAVKKAMTSNQSFTLLGLVVLAYLVGNPQALTAEYWKWISSFYTTPYVGDRFHFVEAGRIETGVLGLQLSAFFHAYILQKPMLPVLVFFFYGAVCGIRDKSKGIYFLLIWMGFISIYLFVPSIQTRYPYLLWPAMLIVSAYGIMRAAQHLSFLFTRSERLTLSLTTTASLLIFTNGVYANVKLAPYQMLYTNPLARLIHEAPVLLSNNELYATGAEKKLLDYLNETAKPNSIIGTVIPRRPTVPILVYEYYGRKDFRYVDVNQLHGKKAFEGSRNIDYFLIPRYKSHHVSPELNDVLKRFYRNTYNIYFNGTLAGAIFERRTDIN